MTRRTVAVQNELGLHARAAAKMVKLASQFQSEIKLSRLEVNEEVDAKSILGLLLLAACRGTTLEIRANGSDERVAVDALVALIESRFGEKQ